MMMIYLFLSRSPHVLRLVSNKLENDKLDIGYTPSKCTFSYVCQNTLSLDSISLNGFIFSDLTFAFTKGRGCFSTARFDNKRFPGVRLSLLSSHWPHFQPTRNALLHNTKRKLSMVVSVASTLLPSMLPLLRSP